MNTPKRKWKFMWGQRQSAMITEAMMEQVTVAFDDEGKEIDSGVRETFFVSLDGVFSHYMPGESVKDLEKNSRRYESEMYTKNVFQGIDTHIQNFFMFGKRIRSADVAALSHQELLKLFTQYRDFITRTFHYFATSTPQGAAFVVDQIKMVLSEKLPDKNIVQDYFITVSTPNEMDETMKERIDFLKIAENPDAGDADLEQYARTYPALFFNTYDEKSVMMFLKDRLLQQRQMKISSAEEEQKMRTSLAGVRAKQEKIYSEIGSELKRYTTILHHAALGRYRLKHVWSGGEYVCLNLIKEAQKRVGVDFDTFIKTYRFSDTIHFLETGGTLTETEVKERKKCFALHFYEKTVHLLIGDTAIKTKDALVVDESKDTETRGVADVIKGAIANLGIARGRARVVFVEDLAQFIKDSAVFKRGEVLVTTMTSPVMVPLIEKAVAIVTDEGGITSHAAVVSREFNIPCIVGTHGASSIIRTGDEIEVDANKGFVRILK